MADRLHVSVSMHEGVSVMGGGYKYTLLVQMYQSVRPLSRTLLCYRGESGCALGAECWVQKSELNSSSSLLQSAIYSKYITAVSCHFV